MSSKFNVSLIEEMKDGSRSKKGKEIVVSFEKDSINAGSFYRAGKDFNGTGQYLLETHVLENGEKVVKVLNLNGKLNNFVDGKNVKQEGDYIVLKAAEIKCLPNSQISISVKGSTNNVSTIDVRAGDLVVNKGQKGSVSFMSENPINLELSENFFEDISLNRVKCGVLPAQAFEAAAGLKNTNQKVFRVNGEELKFLTINGNPNKLFLASGTEIRELANVIDGSKEHEQNGIFAHDFGFQFRGGDFGQGKVGAIASILENVSSDKANEILAYIKSQNVKTSIEKVSPETYQTKIKNVSKFYVSNKSQVTKEIGIGPEEPSQFVPQSAMSQILNVNLNSPKETEKGESMEEKIVEPSETVSQKTIQNVPFEPSKSSTLEQLMEETKIKNVTDDTSSNSSGSESTVGIAPASSQSASPNNPSSDNSNEEEEETVEVVSEQPSNEEENNKDSKEGKTEKASKEDGQNKEGNSNNSEKKYKPQYPASDLHVPLNPLRVFKQCLFGAAVALFVALTVVTFLGGLLAPAFAFLSMAIGTATIMSSELVGDLKARAQEKQKALTKEQKRLEKEIEKEKAKQKNKENVDEKADEQDKQEEKDEENEESLEPDDNKKKKTKKLKVSELVAKYTQKRAEQKEKVKEAKTQASLSAGAQAEKSKKVTLQSKKVQEEAKEKKSAKELKREAEKNALRKKIAENRTANYRSLNNSAAVNPQPKASSNDLDMGM